MISSQNNDFILIGNFNLIEEQNKEHKNPLVYGKFLLISQEYNINVVVE